MDYDKDKVDELTLALLFLVTHDRKEGVGARAWRLNCKLNRNNGN